MELGEGTEGQVHVGPMRQEPTRAGRTRQQGCEGTLGRPLWREETPETKESWAGPAETKESWAGPAETKESWAGPAETKESWAGPAETKESWAGPAETKESWTL